MEEAEAREKLLRADLDDVTTKFNRLLAAGGGKKSGGALFFIAVFVTLTTRESTDLFDR